MTDLGGVDITDSVRTAETEPVVPDRFRRPMIHRVADAVPPSWCGRVSRWLFEHRGEMRTEVTAWRAAHEIDDLQRRCPEIAAELRAGVVRSIVPSLEGCGVADFDVTDFTMRGSLMHRHCFQAWVPGAGADDPEVRLCYELTLCTDPRMFSGGEREFLDGTAIDPQNGLLLLSHPLQTSRVREVECWSQHALDGRWSLWGEIVGPKPDGWDKVVERMRAV